MGETSVDVFAHTRRFAVYGQFAHRRFAPGRWCQTSHRRFGPPL